MILYIMSQLRRFVLLPQNHSLGRIQNNLIIFWTHADEIIAKNLCGSRYSWNWKTVYVLKTASSKLQRPCPKIMFNNCSGHKINQSYLNFTEFCREFWFFIVNACTWQVFHCIVILRMVSYQPRPSHYSVEVLGFSKAWTKLLNVLSVKGLSDLELSLKKKLIRI